MYLSEALTKLKNLKSKAKRVESYIEGSAVYYEDQPPEYVYLEEIKSRAKIQEEILTLKVNIQRTNTNTWVKFGGKTITLTELILLNTECRTELAFLAKQTVHALNSDSRYGASNRTKDEIKKVFAPGCDKSTFKKAIDSLEQSKEGIEAIMASTNASTPLIEG